MSLSTTAESPAWQCTPLTRVLWRQRQAGFCEPEASLVYTQNSTQASHETSKSIRAFKWDSYHFIKILFC